MLAYTYVEGASLADFILRVRGEFAARLPRGRLDGSHPDSVRVIALEVYDRSPIGEQLAVLTNLIEANDGLLIERDNRQVFACADTPANYIADLVCEVVSQILMRDPAIRAEDGRRMALAAEYADERDEWWRLGGTD